MNGALYDCVNARAERTILAPIREQLLKPLSGRIVEVGSGTGADFAHYGRSAQVAALEPDRAMIGRAYRRLGDASATIELHEVDDRWLETLPSGSVDAVVFPLALCTVDDPRATLARTRRVLRSRGKLVVLEHIRSAGGLGRAQDVIAPVWRRVAGGCHLNRDTVATIAASGFNVSGLQERRLPWFLPIQSLIWGEAYRAND